MRIAFCCKYLHPDRTLKPPDLKRLEAPFNCKSLQATALTKLDPTAQYAKLEAAILHNISATENLIRYVAILPLNQRMVRLGSDILPLYTHPVAKPYYLANTKWIAEALGKIGQLIRAADIRLDMHPGPFTIFNTSDKTILANSISEIEAHTDIFRWFGLTGWHTGGSMINIHMGNKLWGSSGFRTNLPLLSQDARNLLTVENDEFSCGLDECLELADVVPVTLDIHHHWVATGEYIQPSDPRVKQVRASWQGVRPAIHYSQSPESEGIPTDSLPDFHALIKSGHSRTKLRSHSHYYINKHQNKWARGFGEDFDIICESKAKNLASASLAKEWF